MTKRTDATSLGGTPVTQALQGTGSDSSAPSGIDEVTRPFAYGCCTAAWSSAEQPTTAAAAMATMPGDVVMQ